METNDLEKHITRIFYEDGESVYGAHHVYQLSCKELSKLEEKFNSLANKILFV